MTRVGSQRHRRGDQYSCNTVAMHVFRLLCLLLYLSMINSVLCFSLLNFAVILFVVTYVT